MLPYDDNDGALAPQQVAPNPASFITSRSLVFVELRLQELAVLFLTVGTLFALLVAMMGGACCSIMVVTTRYWLIGSFRAKIVR